MTIRTGVYPGTFDPITRGHMDIIRRGAKLVDRLVIGVTTNPSKSPMFTIDERMEMVKRETADIQGEIHVVSFDSLLMDFAEREGASLILRGLRAVADFEYEYQMAGMNQQLNDDIETVFLMADVSLQPIASRLVKEIARYGGAIDKFVTPAVARDVAAHERRDAPDRKRDHEPAAPAAETVRARRPGGLRERAHLDTLFGVRNTEVDVQAAWFAGGNLALGFPACRKLLGPVGPGAELPGGVVGVGAAHAVLEMLQLADQIPRRLARQPGRVERLVALRLRAMTGRARLEQRLGLDFGDEAGRAHAVWFSAPARMPRGLTVTGGLPYFGGPGNNYSTHGIAEMVARCRAAPAIAVRGAVHQHGEVRQARGPGPAGCGPWRWSASAPRPTSH